MAQDPNECSTKSGRNPSKRETGGGVQRRDGTFQSRVIVSIPVLLFFEDQYTKLVFVDLLNAKNEALASLKKFAVSGGRPKN